MSWTEVSLPTGKGFRSVQASGVTMTAAPASRFRARITITFRPEVIGEEAAWIVIGARYRLLVGSGEHAGSLRIERASQGRIFGSTTGRREAMKRPVIVLQGLDWLPDVKRPATIVDHDSGDGWVEIVLPDWARTPTIPARATHEPVSSVPSGPGFTMIGGKLDDPQTAGRRGTVGMRSAGARA